MKAYLKTNWPSLLAYLTLVCRQLCSHADLQHLSAWRSDRSWGLKSGVWTVAEESSITYVVTIISACSHISPVTGEMVCVWNKSAAELQAGYSEFQTWFSPSGRAFCPFIAVNFAAGAFKLSGSLSLLCTKADTFPEYSLAIIHYRLSSCPYLLSKFSCSPKKTLHRR